MLTDPLGRLSGAKESRPRADDKFINVTISDHIGVNMTQTQTEIYDLPKRLKQIDPNFDDSTKPMAVLGFGRLSPYDETHYGFHTNFYGKEPTFLVSRELVEERGYEGDKLGCFLVEYTSGETRRLELIPMPLAGKGSK